jgi:outer membrane biosynthesis protein TonB
MAKKQTFESKLSKKGSNFKYVKHIKSVVSEDSGFIKFLDNMVRLEENENIDQALKRMEEESKQVLSFGESIEEAPAEEVKEDAPAEEVKEDAPVEESKEEAPAEEVKEDAPVEESKEEAPAEEVKEDAPVEEAEPATEDQSAEEADVSSDK